MAQNIIQTFSNAEYGELKVYVKDGEPWFKGKEVAEMLGYSNTRDAINKHVDEDDVAKRDTIDSLGRTQNSSFINESGLYALILSSKLPTARQFKHWVTSVVLPQIRKTGGYIPVGSPSAQTADDDNSILARALLIAQKTIEMKNGMLEAQRPKVVFADAVTASNDSILIRDLAKLLTQNGFNIGQTRLFLWLRQHGYLFQRETRPIQKWVEEGLFETNVTLVQTHHCTKECLTTKVTGKGQEYFLRGFMGGKFTISQGV